MADLGVGVRNLIDEGGFARIRQAEHADIGKQLEPQPHPHLLARNARLVLARGAIGAGFVAGIAATAHAAFEEDLKGSLTPGKLAGITVLSQNILTVPEEEIPSTEVVYTIVGGRVLYQR